MEKPKRGRKPLPPTFKLNIRIERGLFMKFRKMVYQYDMNKTIHRMIEEYVNKKSQSV